MIIRIMVENNEPPEKFTELPEKYMERIQKMLSPGEKIEFSLRCILATHSQGMNVRAHGAGAQGDQMGHPWMVITNQRLWIVSKGLISFEERQFRFEQISSVEIKQGIIEDHLIITGMGVNEDWTFWKKLRNQTMKAIQILQAKINQRAQGSGSGNVQQDPLTELKLRLVRGEITQDEFEKLKSMI
ncbi:MAG: PH domain-containing protein [Candidatus Thermoplasmatota archaeon]|nr:PH domain-containing protein [Candidatus Thermoplasmatota archaeon]